MANRAMTASHTEKDVAEIAAGQWVVFQTTDYARFTFGQALVEKVTAKQLAVTKNSRWAKRITRSSVLAVVESEDAAAKLMQSLDGITGEFTRRRRSADEERNRRVSEADSAARKQIARLISTPDMPKGDG